MILNSLYAIFYKALLSRVSSIYTFLTVVFLITGVLAFAENPLNPLIPFALIMHMQKKLVHPTLNKYGEYLLIGGPRGNQVGYLTEQDVYRGIINRSFLLVSISIGLWVLAFVTIVYIGDKKNNAGWVAHSIFFTSLILPIIILTFLSMFSLDEVLTTAKTNGATVTSKDEVKTRLKLRWLLLILVAFFWEWGLNTVDDTVSLIQGYDLSAVKVSLATTVFDIAAYSQGFFDKFI